MSDNTLEQRCLDFERINYYFGKMMLVRDFQDQQRYYNEKRWMVNRFGLGWGVLAGLRVAPHPRGGLRVLVEPGFALDQYGHEIWVCKAQTLELETADQSTPEQRCVYIYLRYRECLSEAAPVPAEECGELTSGCNYNRTRETFDLFASAEPPEGIEPFDHPVNGLSDCELECHQFLANPVRLLNQGCPPRNPCLAIPLAKICYDPGDPQGKIAVDNIICRKIAGSNELLYELIACLTRELWTLHAARTDRRQFVPLLVQSIKGLHYRDGRIRSHELPILQPCRLAGDGRDIWITDKSPLTDESFPNGHVVRLHQDGTRKLIGLDESAWGIAFDGHYMWITHPESENGNEENTPGIQLTRIDVCKDDIQTPYSLSQLKPYPQEILCTDEFLFVLHRWDSDENALYLSLIDPVSLKDPENGYGIIDLQINKTKQQNPVGDTGETELLQKVVMVYDGEAIWVAYAFKGEQDSRLPRACLAKVRIRQIPGSPPEMQLEVEKHLVLKSRVPEDLSFDGSHVWITHDEGVTRVDASSKNELIHRDNSSSGPQSALTFDGQFVWSAQNRELRWSAQKDKFETMLSRIDTLTLAVEEGEEIRVLVDAPNTPPGFREVGNLEVSQMFFDGAHIWIAATGEYDDEFGNQPAGIIHRILA
ncbi:MAG: hypothetical protein H6628_09775 [Calditrichae bacterium]|nr:hypothetical protein [Calditrichota bacterium]MCB9088585.1 hypothetical protein [Calditrichia bacterium]